MKKRENYGTGYIYFQRSKHGFVRFAPGVCLSICHHNEHVLPVAAIAACAGKQLAIGQLKGSISTCVTRGVWNAVDEIGHGNRCLVLDIREPDGQLSYGVIGNDPYAGTMRRDLQLVNQRNDELLGFVEVCFTDGTRAVNDDTDIHGVLTGRGYAGIWKVN